MLAPLKCRLLVAALSLASLSLTAAERTLSFSQAEQRLVDVRQVLIQQADIKAREAERKALDDLNLPQVSILVAGIAYEKDVSFTIPFVNERADLDINKSGLRSQVSVIWPLYTGGRTKATQQLASSRLSEAQAEQKILQLQLLKRLSDLYFSNQMMRQVVSVREKTLDTISMHVNRAKRFQEEGLITELGKMQADVAYAEANRELLLAKRQYSDIQAALKNLIETDTFDCLSTKLPVPVALSNSPDWFVSQARSGNPIYQQLAEKLKQTSKLIAIEQGKKRPEFFVAASYDLNRSATPLTEPDWSVGVGMRYNFTTPVNRNASIDSARMRQEQVKLTKEQADADVKLAIESSYRAVQEHLEQFQLLQHDIDLATEHSRLQHRAFEEGLATSLEVTDAQLRLAATEVKALNAAFLYISALAQLTQLTGQPELLVEILPSLAQHDMCSTF
ncbi:TolC family protein [Alkalimonas collagenimarina]|uniref:TolC family protein n=1 Tax=Alkalimonas collagenimarina TaxID=400390 RepID=A0ABT9GXS3_9GAMM|nr:TolC family protein [Alkalimonas collagenimarina]MDP4535860.1 TolC family protein [Alkalimonas collagenimarina]